MMGNHEDLTPAEQRYLERVGRGAATRADAGAVLPGIRIELEVAAQGSPAIAA
jgi:hypothetical protein